MCFLVDVQNYLPQDFYGLGREGATGSKLRQELVQDEEYEEMLLTGGNLSSAVSRVKVSNETRNAVNILTEVGRSIPERVTAVVQELENLDYVITNSPELSDLLHKAGINMRYLGLLLDHCKEPWLKAIVTSEIIARAAKYFLRYDLQDSLLNLSAGSLREINDYQIGQVLGWINRILGIGP